MRTGFEKSFKTGDIVYWCHNDGGGKYKVNYGRVCEQFSDAVVMIDYLEPRERRRVNGIPIDEFQSEQRYRKLPKGWTWNTQLYEITYDDLTPAEKVFKLDIKDPKTIKAAYDSGFLVKSETIFHGEIDDEITKEGYRIVKKYPMWKHHIDHVSIYPHQLYFTYEGARVEVDNNIAEFQRQANLSDYEWSVEQIDKTLRKWRILNSECEETSNKYREWLHAMKNVEEIETRIFGTAIQWKYWKNKKWNYIEL